MSRECAGAGDRPRDRAARAGGTPRPGAFVFLGSGVAPDGSFAALHTPDYDFNDDLLSIGAACWVELVRAELG